MNKLLVIDTETGGVDSEVHSLLSLGAVVWLDGRAVSEFAVAVAEDPLVVTPRAMEINRIDLVALSKSAVTPREAASRLQAFVEEQFGSELVAGEKVVLAGHNVGFDVGFLKRLFRLADRSFESLFSHRTLDTASVLKFLSLTQDMPSGTTSSDAAFAFFDIQIPEADRHSAIGDARATAALLTCLVDRWSIRHTTPGQNAAA